MLLSHLGQPIPLQSLENRQTQTNGIGCYKRTLQINNR